MSAGIDLNALQRVNPIEQATPRDGRERSPGDASSFGDGCENDRAARERGGFTWFLYEAVSRSAARATLRLKKGVIILTNALLAGDCSLTVHLTTAPRFQLYAERAPRPTVCEC